MNNPPSLNLILKQCLTELLGEEDVNLVWSAQMDEELFSLKSVSQILAARYGKKGAKGILFSLGRNLFTQVLVWLGEDAGFSQKEFKLLPLRKKIPVGMENLAGVFRHNLSDQIEVRSKDNIHFWVMCGSFSDNDEWCIFFCGLLQEYMAWMCAGKVFIVEEITCRNNGADECCFRIPANSIE